MSEDRRGHPHPASPTTPPPHRVAHALAPVLLAVALIGPAPARAAAEAVPMAQVEAALARTPSRHPSLFATAEDLQRLTHAPIPGSLQDRLLRETIRQAEGTLGEDPIERTLKGRRLLLQSRTCLGRVLVLATAYHATQRNEFLRRAERELLAAAAFNDWNPAHFLDVAEMSLALAIGYDWLYPQLPASTRQTLRQALVEKALRLPLEPRYQHWIDATHNWGQVCHAGLTLTALALRDEEPELARTTVHSAVNHVRHAMEAYAPRGSFPEGPGYWSFGTSFNVVLIDGLQSVLGTDFGLTSLPGFAETGQYLALVTGPSGETFNYSDGSSRRTFEPALYWFARRSQRPDWLHAEPPPFRGRPTGPGRLQALALLWSAGLETNAALPPRMPLNWLGEGPVPVAVHRTSWDDARAVFVGIKGGSPSYNHGHMDGGSFVMDAHGLRWAVDLGAEDYDRIESRGMALWNKSEGSPRWTVFRLSNLAHNTLVIDGRPQRVGGFAPIVQPAAPVLAPHSRIDLTSLYAGQATAVQRGIALLPSGETVIRDELAGLHEGAEVRWGMLTPAAATATATGNARLDLQQKGRTISLHALSEDGSPKGDWSISDLGTPPNPWDSPNPGLSLLAWKIAAPASGTIPIAVVLQPRGALPPSEAARKLALLPLAQWH